jgi:A/G-specific adenine glycosylase
MSLFSNHLALWYQKNKRDLPWRNTNNPYHIWLSEVILQQTRVDQGLPYFQRFKQHYPTIQDLANANEQAILNDWQGLGYYSRARNLHKTAKLISELGAFPENYADLLQLKGIGPYTAAALASFAFKEKKAVVDGNVYRVLSRYFGVEIPIDSTQGKKYFQELADNLIPDSNPDLHNQAIMEFGALQCVPKNPNCQVCPLIETCEAYRTNKIQELPIKSKKTKVKNRFFHYHIKFDGDGKFEFKQRINKDIWQGLYEFNLMELENENEFLKSNSSHFEYVSKTYTHILSHQRIQSIFFISKSPNKNESTSNLTTLNEIPNYPIPRLIEKFLEEHYEILAEISQKTI